VKATQQLNEIGQSLWLDNITRGMLNDGTHETYVRDYSVTDLTGSRPRSADRSTRDDEPLDASGQAWAAVLESRHPRGMEVSRWRR
jgi:transaldolase